MPLHLAIVKPSSRGKGFCLHIRGDTRAHWYPTESGAISYAFCLLRDNGGGRIWILNSRGHGINSETVEGRESRSNGLGAGNTSPAPLRLRADCPRVLAVV
jgi:hypothetical protein